MYRVLSRMNVLAPASLCLVLASVLACGPSGPTEEEIAAARDADVVEAEQAKKALEDLRAEQAELRTKLEGEVEEGAEEVEELTDEARQGLQAQIDALDLKIDEAAEQLGALIAEKVNANPPIQGEPLDPYQQRLIDIKVDEDLMTAQEWIDKGGDYAKAINIYQSLLPLDPDNERVNAALEAAEADRFMTEERFSQLKKGMSEDEVREILGPVNLRNIRPYTDRGVTLWLYLREDGNAAGVYFRERRGKQAVYSFDFDAVVKDEESE